MNRRSNSLILLALYFILVVACTPIVTSVVETTPVMSTASTAESPINWWIAWLDEPTCQPPCWQNIIPGITTRDEGISILDNSQDFSAISKSKYGVSWKFSQNKDEGGTLSISEAGIVNLIWLGSASDRKLLLKMIVASYNYPRYLKPYDCREEMCEGLLIYPDIGMFLTVYLENTGTIDNPQLEILSEASVDRVYFFEPGMESFQKLSFQDYDLLIEWKGYGKYP